MPSTSHCEQRGQPDCEGAAQDFALAAKHFAFSAEQFVQIMRRGALRGSLLKRPAFPSRNAPERRLCWAAFDAKSTKLSVESYKPCYGGFETSRMHKSCRQDKGHTSEDASRGEVENL
jgi:hypothetical protein